jgi:probable phosphoglycerate mutase
MNKTEMIIVRHGKTVWNEEGRFQGQQDSPLTATGIRQAEALAERLKRENFSVIYASDLGRVTHTAEIIARKTGHHIITNPSLRERSFGIFEGFTKEEIAEKDPQEFERFSTLGYKYVPPGGESIDDVSRRVMRYLNDLAGKHPNDRFLVVTHGGIIGRLFRIVFNLPTEATRRFRVANAGINIFTYEEENWHLETWGDIAHLRDGTAFKETGEALWT